MKHQPHVTGVLSAVVGDDPFEAQRHRPVAESDSDVDRIRAHLSHVATALRSRPEVSDGIPRILDAYAAAGTFPSAFQYREDRHANAKRIPCFIDDAGTHCALGHLLKETGAADLAERINASHRFLYVDEIVAEAEPATVDALVAWGDRRGLNATDFATIQPTYDFINPTPPIIHPMPVPPPPTVVEVIHDAMCDNCYANIVGIRYKCVQCDDYDLCATCEGNNVHNADHAFLKLRKPVEAGTFTPGALVEGPIYDPNVVPPAPPVLPGPVPPPIMVQHGYHLDPPIEVPEAVPATDVELPVPAPR